MSVGIKKETLCWTCQNAVPSIERGCSWSRTLTPVEGWMAILSEGVAQSYTVVDCPEYIEDEPTE